MDFPNYIEVPVHDSDTSLLLPARPEVPSWCHLSPALIRAAGSFGFRCGCDECCREGGFEVYPKQLYLPWKRSRRPGGPQRDFIVSIGLAARKLSGGDGVLTQGEFEEGEGQDQLGGTGDRGAASPPEKPARG